MRQFKIIVPSGSSLDLAVVGDYVRIKASDATLKIESRENGEFAEMASGDAAFFSKFKNLSISHSLGTDLTVSLLIGNGTRYDVSGNRVNVIPNRTHGDIINNHADWPAGAVGASATQLRASRPERVYLMIQNNDPSIVIWIHFGYAPQVAAGKGIRLLPGQMWENPPHWCPTGIIYAVTTMGTTSLVSVFEGVE